MSARFVFRHTWAVAAPPAAVFDVLADVGGYPTWWPQVRAVHPGADPERVAVTIRSALPYSLRLVLVRQVERAPAGRLRVGLEGDLDGFAEFEVRAGGPGTVVDYRQEVELTTPLLRRLAPVVGPALRANHAHMMRGGGRGLAAHPDLR